MNEHTDHRKGELRYINDNRPKNAKILVLTDSDYSCFLKIKYLIILSQYNAAYNTKIWNIEKIYRIVYNVFKS